MKELLSSKLVWIELNSTIVPQGVSNILVVKSVKNASHHLASFIYMNKLALKNFISWIIGKKPLVVLKHCLKNFIIMISQHNLIAKSAAQNTCNACNKQAYHMVKWSWRIERRPLAYQFQILIQSLNTL